jgi:methylglutaconyl-CoA hydratase
MEGYVKTTLADRLAVIEFFHPAHNSMPGYLLNLLKEAIEQSSEDANVGLILLKSAGEKSFCAGASFTELSSIKNIDESKTFFNGFASVINAIRTSSKLVIGRIQGKAVGGGVGLAAACDYTLATEYASVRLSELAVGIGPFVIGPAVERKVGFSAFSHMALTPAEWQTAQWAKQKGLFLEVFSGIQQMDDYINAFTKTLLSYNPDALTNLKNIFWEGTSDWDTLLEERAAISGNLLLSDFSKSAIYHFLNQG